MRLTIGRIFLLGALFLLSAALAPNAYASHSNGHDNQVFLGHDNGRPMAFAGTEMVTICHKAGTSAEQTKQVAMTAVPGHLAQGDTEGPCGRPLGGFQKGDDGADVGRCFGGDRCIEFTVTCPNMEDAEGTLLVTGTGAAGTVVLTTGGRGTGLFGNTQPEPGQDPGIIDEFLDALLNDGYLLVELGWSVEAGGAGNGVWEGPGTATALACRSATAINWISDNLHEGGFFIAQGNSGGSAQIAFSLAYYGMDVLDLANLSGGPPPCPISTDGQLNFDEQDQCVVRGELFDESREPMLFGAPRLDYPNTTVRFFIGETEPSSYIVDTANEFHKRIRSDKSFQFVPNTGHQVARTEEGLDALLASIRDVAGS